MQSIVVRVGDDAVALRKELAPFGRFAQAVLTRASGKAPLKKGVENLLNQ